MGGTLSPRGEQINLREPAVLKELPRLLVLEPGEVVGEHVIACAYVHRDRREAEMGLEAHQHPE